MRKLNPFFEMTSVAANKIISVTEETAAYNMIVLSAEKGCLKHFYVRAGKKFVLFLSEFCQSFDVAGDGRLLQTNYPKYSAISYVNKDNHVVCHQASFMKIESFKVDDFFVIKGLTEVLVEQFPALSKGNHVFEDKYLFYYPDKQYVSG